MLSIHLLWGAQIPAIGVLTHESGVHDVGVIQYELLDGRALTGPGIPELMKSPEEWKPGVIGSSFRCPVIDEPLPQTLKCS